jgi:uncharacterized phage-associated protein
MSTPTASQIADVILVKASKKGQLVSNLKLQKLLYYVQGHHLAKLGKPAFSDKIKAWSHGPVVPVVYHRFKAYSWHDIDEIPKDVPHLPEPTNRIINWVLSRYLGLSGVELEDMTHAERPWIEARDGYSIGEAVSPEIPISSIKRFFRKTA